MPNGTPAPHRSERAILRSKATAVTLEHVPELTDREVLEAILTSCQHVHMKLDHVLEYLGEDGEEEEDERDG